MKRFFLLLSAAFAGFSAGAAEPAPCAQIANVGARQTISLAGRWNTIVDPYDNGYLNYRLAPLSDEGSFFAGRSFFDNEKELVEYSFDNDGSLYVPADWNTQDPKLYYYEGTVWYRRKFNVAPQEGKRYFLYFAGANYETVVGFNGHKVGRHVGGFTPFNFEVTGSVKNGENFVIARVNNTRHPEGVPTINCDWWNYGGLTRDVLLVETPSTFIHDYGISLKGNDTRTVSGWVKLDGPAAAGASVRVNIVELGVNVTVKADADGNALFEAKAKPQLWCPENPKLYAVSISSGEDAVADEIGFRTIEVKGTKVLLNGKEIFLKGVCVHEEKPCSIGGRVSNEQDISTLIGWAKEMNCNFLRLAHYPHSEAMIRAAEKAGLLVWSEIPVYWTIHWNNPDTYANAENQLCENITRDHNRANIIIWSVANETPRSEARLKFLSGLIDKARQIDGSRLVAAAMEKEYIDPYTLTANDELISKADLISFNQYLGWYDGTPEKCDSVKWVFDTVKPVVITECGGGCAYGRHGDKSHRFTEENQEYLYQKLTAMYDRMPELAGVTPWILTDFLSPRRQLKDVQDDFNRKGLISNMGQKKKAFFVMKNWYATKDYKKD